MRPALTPISQIDRDFVGLRTRVSGRIIETRGHADGHLFLRVKDESGGVIFIPLFSNVKSELDEKIELVDRIQVSGKIEIYEGDLELIPEDATDVKIVKTAPTKISEIDRNRLGEKVKVRGFVEKKKPVGTGNLIVNLRDEEKSLPIFISRKVVESKNFPEIREGQTVQTAGQVMLFDNELQIEIPNPHNIDVIGEVR